MTSLCTALTPDDFDAFFREIYGYDPFPWQVELAGRACTGNWPEYLSVPTGSGKTATLDVAVFALAAQASRPPSERTIGRRIFYVVNRRIIVDEAYERARRMAQALHLPQSHQPTVARVADALRTLNPGAAFPIECVQLRGGIYRDQRWAASLTQPLIVASTVDQVGSRLLFRGYGVSASMRPIHAALVAYDSLLLLDEAHISRPFAQTLTSIAAYRANGSHRSQKPGTTASAMMVMPFTFVQMTATPPADAPESSILRLSKKDHAAPTLVVRLQAEKLTVLVIATASGSKALENLASALADQAKGLHEKYHPNSIAVFVNRVATAHLVAKLLAQKYSPEQVTLLIGRMRPLDRDAVTQTLREELKTRQPGEEAPATSHPSLRIVVATQCLEVGADFDFDALVTECASLDALRQRFGRLNRGGRPIRSRAVVVIRSDQIFPESEELEQNLKASDPIYGTALVRTWNWLTSIVTAGSVDFGVNAMDAHVAAFLKTEESRDKFRGLLSPIKDAPVLLPAHLDAWSQTNPEPVPQPEPALFIHGPGSHDSDVQVCWRADLPDQNARLEDWIDTISLCPPSTVECLSIPLGEFRQWFLTGIITDTGDVLAAPISDNFELDPALKRTALIWRGLRESNFLKPTSGIRPGDTVILRAQEGGWEKLGHVPDATFLNIDQAERAYRQTKGREILRLRPIFFPEVTKDSALAELLLWACDENRDWTATQLCDVLLRARAEVVGSETMHQTLTALSDRKYGLDWKAYGDGKGVILKTRHRVSKIQESADEDDGDDILSVSEQTTPLSLEKHLADVVAATQDALQYLPLEPWSKAIEAAAALHDWGKADERFQALLLNGDPSLAWAQSTLFAKSAKLPESAGAYEAARHRADLPRGFRHEMLSVQLAETESARPLLSNDVVLRAITLHLIASHHGYARPFASVVSDNTSPDVELQHGALRIHLTSEVRAGTPAHRIDSGIAERFWQLTRHFGWWGLAYLESVVRLADQQASTSENHIAPTNEK